LLSLKIHGKVNIAVFGVMFIVAVGVSQQYNIYSKTAIFFEKSGTIMVPKASRRDSGLVQL